MDSIQLFTTVGSCMDEIPTIISERYIHSNNNTAENNTTQNMFAFSIMPSNAYWQILLICVDIYVFAMITRDWLERTGSMIETENTLST